MVAFVIIFATISHVHCLLVVYGGGEIHHIVHHIMYHLVPYLALFLVAPIETQESMDQDASYFIILETWHEPGTVSYCTRGP